MFNGIFSAFERLFDPISVNTIGSPLAPGATTYSVTLSLLSEMRVIFCSLLILGAAVSGLDIVIIWSLGGIVDSVNAGSNDTTFNLAITVIFLLGLRPLIGALYLLIKNQSFNPTLGTLARLRFHQYIDGHAISFFHGDFAGRVAAKVGQTGSAFRQALRIVADSIWTGAISLLATVILFASVDLRLLAPLCAWVVAYIAILAWMLPRHQKTADKGAEAISQLNGTLVDAYSNHALVKLLPERPRDPVLDAMQFTLRTVQQQSRISTGMDVAMWSLNCVLVATVLSLALFLASVGEITVGTVAAAVAVLIRLQTESMSVMFNLSLLSQTVGTIENSIRTVSLPHEIQDRASACPTTLRGASVEFRGVHFGFDENEAVLRGVEFSVDKGSPLFIVGRSGEGKSTIADLVVRFYDADRGQVLVDGIDVVDLRQSDLRQAVSYVQQHPSFFNVSIGDNLRFAAPNASDDQITQALTMACAVNFVAEFEDSYGCRGLQASPGEGGRLLSRGQAQRLGLARAIIKNSPIVLLDEAFSGLDPLTEAEVWRNLEGWLHERTAIVITHRPTTISDSSIVSVLDGGQIVETGRAGHLRALQGGVFRSLDDADARLVIDRQ